MRDWLLVLARAPRAPIKKLLNWFIFFFKISVKKALFGICNWWDQFVQEKLRSLHKTLQGNKVRLRDCTYFHHQEKTTMVASFVMHMRVFMVIHSSTYPLMQLSPTVVGISSLIWSPSTTCSAGTIFWKNWSSHARFSCAMFLVSVYYKLPSHYRSLVFVHPTFLQFKNCIRWTLSAVHRCLPWNALLPSIPGFYEILAGHV